MLILLTKTKNMSRKGCVYYDHKINASGDVFDGEFIDGHPYGKCKINFVNGMKYNGYVVYGIPNGFGSYFYPDGMSYKGDIFNGKKHGNGKLTFEQGSCYEGSFIDDIASGHGKITYSSGKKYTGEFLNGLPNGYGKFMFPNRNIYEGFVQNGMKHGKGKIINSEGIVIYCGDFHTDKGHGNGVYLEPGKYIYHGQFKDNVIHGNGKYTYSNGTYYEGSILNNKKHGFGKQSYLDGTVYAGNFENDQRNGKGTITDVNSAGPRRACSDADPLDLPKVVGAMKERMIPSSYVGIFKDDDFSDYGFMKYPNGSIYKVNFSFEDIDVENTINTKKDTVDDFSVINLFEEMGPNSILENVSNYKNKNRLSIFVEISTKTLTQLGPPPGLGFNSPSNDKKGENKKSRKFYPRKKNSGRKSPVS